jgi:hypothetical protein
MKRMTILGLLIAGALLSSGCRMDTDSPAVNRYVDSLYQKVAADQIDQYNMVERNHGTDIEICVHAGLVAAAFLQAKDEKNYSKWQDIKRRDCTAAGLPSY